MSEIGEIYSSSSGDIKFVKMKPVFISGYVDLDETRVTRKVICAKCGERYYDVLDRCPICGQRTGVPV